MLWWLSVAPLGKPGGARGVLDVDRVVRARASACSRASSARSPPRPASTSASQSGVPISTTWRSSRAVRPHLLDHRGVVGGLEAGRGDEHRDPGLVEHELQLVGAVGRVDVDQDRADLGRGELHQRPLGHVRRPDARPGRPCPARPRAGRAPRVVDVVAQLARRSSGGRSAPRPGPRRRAARRRCGRGCRRWCRRAAGRRRSRRRRTGRRERLRSRRRTFRRRCGAGPHPATIDQLRPPPPDGEARRNRVRWRRVDTLGRCTTRASCSIPPPTPSAGWPGGATPWTPPPWRSCSPPATPRSSAATRRGPSPSGWPPRCSGADAEERPGAGRAGPRAQGRRRGRRGGAPRAGGRAAGPAAGHPQPAQRRHPGRRHRRRRRAGPQLGRAAGVRLHPARPRRPRRAAGHPRPAAGHQAVRAAVRGAARARARRWSGRSPATSSTCTPRRTATPSSRCPRWSTG